MFTIYKKELKHYFYNPFGYILVILATLIVTCFVYPRHLLGRFSFHEALFPDDVLGLSSTCTGSLHEEFC